MRRQLLLALLLLLAALPATAAEVIRDFVSDITIHADGSMLVHESITVRAEGKKIRQGIYRDFPTRYPDRFGGETVVDFTVVAVARDGEPEGWHTEDLSNGVRVYMGRRGVFLHPGVYTYTLTYRTDRQLGFFEDHDELYWNVTGNGWDFPIERAEARVTLPDGATVQGAEAYTGFTGQKLQNYEASGEGTGEADFVTTAPLPLKAGLTIVVTFPKGFVREPSGTERFQWFLRDNSGALVGGIGLLLLIAFYWVIWSRVGRDPEGGPVIPLYEPPPGVSPAAARYVTRMGFDHKCFAAALVSLAVKGRLTIEELQRKDYVLERQEGAEGPELSQGEKALFSKLFAGGKVLELKKRNHTRVSGALKALETKLKGEFYKSHFLTNRGYWALGLFASVICLLAAGLPVAQDPVAFLFMTVWLTGWSFGVYALASQRVWVMLLPFGFFELMGLGMYTEVSSLAVVALLLALVSVNALFFHLLKAPTRAGRQVMDQVEGFKLYLSVAEGDRLKTLGGPERTPELFERYLPYALALGVEQQWSERFADVLAQAGQGEAGGYHPAWYSGTGFRSDRMGSFASGLGAGVASAVASSSTAPGSSSGGGGGGSSGGGGGGGGGGGW